MTRSKKSSSSLSSLVKVVAAGMAAVAVVVTRMVRTATRWMMLMVIAETTERLLLPGVETISTRPVWITSAESENQRQEV